MRQVSMEERKVDDTTLEPSHMEERGSTSPLTELELALGNVLRIGMGRCKQGSKMFNN